MSVQVGAEGKPPEDEASGSNPLGRIPRNDSSSMLYGVGEGSFFCYL
jgi:hypothetical protein